MPLKTPTSSKTPRVGAIYPQTQLPAAISPRRLLWLCAIALILIGCGPASDTPQPLQTATPTSESVAATESSGYPGPDSADPDGATAEAYPPPPSATPDTTGYPPPARQFDESKRFTIDTPFYVGDRTVSGTGVADTPIKIVSVSNVGELLGQGRIDPDGVYTINLLRELDPNETIGIQPSDASNTNNYLDVPGATNIPLVGLLLVTATVSDR